MAKTEPIKVTIGLDTEIGWSGGHASEDGWSGGEPVTIAQQIIHGAVDALVSTIKAELVADIKRSVTAQIDAEVQRVVSNTVASAMIEPFRKMSPYGEPTGDPITLRSMIVDEAKGFMTRRDNDRYGGNRDKPSFQKLLQAEVSQAMQKELQKTIVEARNIVVQRVNNQAATLISDAVKRGLRDL